MSASAKTLLFIFGTRPEAIKMAPLIRLCRAEVGFSVTVCVTAQHRGLLDQVLHTFRIVPDYDLDIMTDNQSLGALTAIILKQVTDVLLDNRPDLVVIQGDTTTTLSAGLAAFYQRIPIAHIEAGLRTNNRENPWPEEMNRCVTSRLATYHFAPTDHAKQALLAEGYASSSIYVSGNTGVDALQIMCRDIETSTARQNQLVEAIKKKGYALRDATRFLLVTSHRRENHGSCFENICLAIQALSRQYPDIDIVYPVHLNPNVKNPVTRLLSTWPTVFLTMPLDYPEFVYMMSKSALILTDSGGIQEEAPSLGKPVLVMRETTERPEGVAMGTVKLVGTDPDRIVHEVSALLTDDVYYQKNVPDSPSLWRWARVALYS